MRTIKMHNLMKIRSITNHHRMDHLHHHNLTVIMDIIQHLITDHQSFMAHIEAAVVAEEVDAEEEEEAEVEDGTMDMVTRHTVLHHILWHPVIPVHYFGFGPRADGQLERGIDGIVNTVISKMNACHDRMKRKNGSVTEEMQELNQMVEFLHTVQKLKHHGIH